VPFLPTASPTPGGVPVAQVIVTTAALAAAFQPLADSETDRGVPTVLRTLDWIDATYSGVDQPARIRAFLRAAHDYWGTEFVVLGGDAADVPPRYVPWLDTEVPTDLYYECLDREWNEDGDGVFAEALTAADLLGWVNRVAVGPDGRIWAAMNVGLTVFDGVSFTHHDVTDGVPSDEVHDVAVDPAGSVWAATAAGAAKWDGAVWTAYGVADGLPGSDVLCILPLGPADVWAGTSLGLAHWDGSTWTAYTTAEGLPADFITALAHDGADVWIGTLFGAVRFTGGGFEVHSTSTSGILSNWIESIAADAQGRVWFAHPDNFFAAGGLSRLDGATWFTDSLPAFGGLDLRSVTAGPAPDEIWCATPTGVFHRSASGDELLDTAAGLPGTECNHVALGAGGDVIVAGADGLSVGTPGAFAVYDETNGLPMPVVTWDDIDLVPDLALGRIPASDPAQVATYLQKLADYRAGLVTDHVESALLLGEIIDAGTDGKVLCDSLAAALPPSFQRVGLYESDGTENTASVLAGLDQGHGIVVHMGHGSYDVLGVGPDSPAQLLFNSQVDAVAAGNRYALVLGTNCNSGGFDHASTMEHFLFAPNGGAVATSAVARTSIAGLDADINRDYLTEIFASADGNLALAYQAVRAARLADRPEKHLTDTWVRRLYLSRSYLGAPTLSLWRSVPGALSVAHPASVPAERAPFAVTVAGAGDGLPVADALVCVRKGDEDYAYGRTDAAGAVTFDFRPESAGTISVTVTAPDRLPYEGAATVLPAGVPNPVANTWQRLPGTPARTGAIPVALALQNVGAAAASPWTVQLSSADPRVAVTVGAGTLPALASGQLGWTSPFEIDVSPAVADGEELELTLDGTGPTTFRETFRIVAEAPRLVLDGVVTAGALIYPRVTNLGAQASGLVSGTLASADGSGAVVDGLASNPSIAPGQTVTFADGFTVTGPASAAFELQLTDALGVSLQTVIDREPPAGATQPASEPRDGGAFVTWAPSPAADLAGYRVLSRDPGGAWADALGRLTNAGAMALVTVPPGGSREVAILAVDLSGHESPDTCFVDAHAADPLLPGWPVELWSAVGPSSMNAADLDGDGTLEILHGSMWEANAVHAFRADGTEWTDGDAMPASAGIFGTTGGRVVSAPLALDADGDGLKEIFAGSYDGMLYGWRTDGPAGPPAALPGFPVQVTTSSLRSTPVPADLDGDGAMELVVVASSKLVAAYETDGTPVTGWPRAMTSGGLHCAPAVADLDGDGLTDVVFGGNSDNQLWAVSGNGADLPGWPVTVGAAVKSSPVLADVDADDVPEIFVIAQDGTVHAFRTDGSALPGWPASLSAPVATPNPSPAVADLDGDGVPEIVVNGDGEIAVLRADGTPLPGTPIVTGVTGQSSPVIADIDGDGRFEILTTSQDDRLHARRTDGTELPGWPRRFTEVPKATPFIADVDGDGDLDVVVGADDGRVQVIDTPGEDRPGAAPWPGYHGGETFDGVYRHVTYPPTGGPEVGPGPAPAGLALAPAAPNPFRSGTELRFTLPEAGPVDLDVIDVRGRLVARVLAGDLRAAGSHAVSWRGRDAAGRAVASGVYFLRLRAAGEVRTRKVLRLR
jgi:hypothetical protein